MFEVLYHPLVSADTEGTEKMPMFCATDEATVKRDHKLYLEEIISDRYRLCSSVPMSAAESTAFDILCPHCGAKLKAISPPAGGTRHGLYECPDCLSHRPQGR